MSSNDKRDLTTKNDSTKAGSATVIGDVVTLPPDSDDVIFTTICDDSISGTVDAELEMSYDKENWCPAVTEEFTTGATVVGWGNEKFLLTKVATEVKNKHAKGSLNFDTSGNEVESGGTRDVLFNFIQKDKPFNLSWWHKSEDQPSATYNPIIFRHGNKDPFTNNKHLNLLPKADSTPVEKKNKHLQAPADIGAPARDIFHEKMGADKPFTINKWFKSSVEPNATDSSPVLFNNGATDGSSFGNGLTASFTKKVVTVPWGNTKYYQAYQHWGNKASRILADNVATGSAPLIRYDRDWTISWWMKTSSSANAYYHTWGYQGTISTFNTQTGTGFENEFGMSFNTSKFIFIFTNSSGTQVGKSLYWSNGEMDGGPTDDEWHFYTLTFNANGETSGDFEFQPSNALHSNTSSPDSQRSMTFYVDGQVFNNDAAPTGGTYHNYLGTVSDCEITSGNKEWYWVEQHHDNNNVPVGEYNQFAVYNEYMTASQVADLYDGTPGTKGGNPTNVSALSSCKVALDFNDDTYANTDSTEFEFTNSAFSGAWASDPYPSKRDTTQAGASTQSLSSGDDTYVAMTVANTFDATASQGTSFLLSLDGFESTSDAWVSYPVGSLLDGNWHNMQITWDGSGSGSKTYGDSTETNNNLKVYIDGEWLAPNAYKGGTTTFTAADKHFKWTTGTFVPGTFGASGWKETSSSTDYEYAFQGAFDQLSLHSEATDLTKAQEFYGKGTIYEGQPHNYQMSDSLTYANVEGWWTFDEGGDSTTVANDKTSNNIDLTLNYFASDGNNLTSNSGQSIYIAPIGRAVGEGFTVSMTKNLKDDGSWVTTNDQTTRLVLSFNGIESEADHFVAYNVNQTGLSKATNLLDGLWHNVVISFQGTTDNSGTTYLADNEIRFGPVTQGSVIQNYHISVSFDGQTLENLVPGGSADQVDDGTGSALSGITGWDVSKKLASGKMEAGFVIEQKDLRHTNSLGTYVPTTYLASGLMEDSGDGKYAFQGGFDDSSFHSDNWWVTADGTLDPNAYNKEKAKTIYGNTGGLETEQQTRRAPYDLRDPASIGATATSNQYINPNPYSSANTTGGMEVYYRWGDTFGDCSESIRDVKSHESSPASTKRDLSAEGTMTHATVLDTDASESTDFTKDLTYDNSGTYKMYVEKTTSTTPGGLSVKNVKISGCGADKCQQQGVLAPKLPHMRVKWSGSGSCDLGDDKCRAQLWFRRRKK